MGNDTVNVSVSKKWIYMTIGMFGSYIAGMLTENQVEIMKKIFEAFSGGIE